MKNGQELYVILRDMISGAKGNGEHDVYTLSKEFEALFPKNFGNISGIEAVYDNCRQSCVMAEQIPMMSQDFIRDAEEKYSEISGMSRYQAS